MVVRRRLAAIVVCSAVLALPGCGGAAGAGLVPTPRPSPSASAAPAVDRAALAALGEDTFPRHPRFGYYVSCVNFPENGAWPEPPRAPDYSLCPLTQRLRDRMTSDRADFVVTQTPWPNRWVQAYPQPGGGLVVVSLGPYLKVELRAVLVGGRPLVDEVVPKGEPPSSQPPLVFQEKPAPSPRATSGPDSRVLAVPWYHQAYELGCEEASLRMALAYEGIAVTEDRVLEAIPIDRTPAVINPDGTLRWGDPFTAFVGDPDGSEISLTGYGTYYPTIVRAAAALGGRVLRSGQGVDAAAVYSAVLAGHPVIAWVTYEWVAAPRHDYVAFDGRTVPYAGPVEHAVLVAGVEPGRVLINNPWSGPEWVTRSAFEAAYATYDQMAVVMG